MRLTVGIMRVASGWRLSHSVKPCGFILNAQRSTDEHRLELISDLAMTDVQMSKVNQLQTGVTCVISDHCGATRGWGSGYNSLTFL
eukprot:976888-Pleurochrysis_carterae.AAC.1